MRLTMWTVLIAGLLVSSNGCFRFHHHGCDIKVADDTALACTDVNGVKAAVNIPVLANDNLDRDKDADDQTTVTIATQGTLGTAVLNADNTITYTATDPASTGTDTF